MPSNNFLPNSSPSTSLSIDKSLPYSPYRGAGRTTCCHTCIYPRRIIHPWVYKAMAGTKKMKVLVCGNKYWTNKDKIKEVLEALPNVDIVMVREQRGVPTLTWEAAKELGKVPIVYFSDKEILNDNPDLVLAFHSRIRLNKETTNLVTEARRRGIPTRIIT